MQDSDDFILLEKCVHNIRTNTKIVLVFNVNIHVNVLIGDIFTEMSCIYQTTQYTDQEFLLDQTSFTGIIQRFITQREYTP